VANIIPIRPDIKFDWTADARLLIEKTVRMEQIPFVLAMQAEMQRLVAATAEASKREGFNAGFDQGCWVMLPFIAAAALVGVVVGWTCA
jgi:hypothetical protein